MEKTEQAIEIARKNALNYNHSCVTVEGFQPHQWVIDAMIEFANALAEEKCKEQRIACSQNELVKSFCELEFEGDKLKFIQQYLLQTPILFFFNP